MLQFKFAERQVVPFPVIETGRHMISADGIECDVSAVAAYDLSHKDHLDKECKMLYGMPFERVMNIWCGRLQRADLDVWYIIKMEKLC